MIRKISEEEEASLILPAQYGPSEVKEQSIEQVGLGLQSQEAKEAAVHKSSTAYIPQQSMLKTSHFEGPRPAVKDLSKTETQKNAEVRSNTNTNLITEIHQKDMSNQSVHRDSPKGSEVDMKLPGQIGLTTVPGTSIQSWSSGKIISSRPADGRSSTLPSSGFQRKQSDNYDTILSNANVPGNPLYSKDFAGSSTRVNSFRHGASTEGNIVPVVHSSQIPLQENITPGKSANRAANTKVSELNSGPNLSKQFLNVIFLY